MNEELLSPEAQKYIRDHQHDDPFLLSLNTKKSSDFPLAEAIEQIQSRQKAKGKLPEWLAKEGIIFPPPISVEQSSSEITARFKAELIHGKSMVDLTGGMGIDTFYFAQFFENVNYVEPNEKLSQLARHNFSVLAKKNVKVHNFSAERFLNENTEIFDAIFIDPSRRSESRKVFKIEDCFPNLYEIIPKCLEISDQVLVKLSPLVDLSLLIHDFSPTDLWVVAVKGEVKEVLCLIVNAKKAPKIHAVDLVTHEKKVVFTYDWEEEQKAENKYSLPLKVIYEPNAAILKSGAFKLLGTRYNLMKLHQHTHLYTSDKLIQNFPGKVLVYERQIKQNKKEITQTIPDNKINVITRNFPLTAAQLKKKFDLKDGGDNFLIGTTLVDGKKVLLWCKRKSEIKANESVTTDLKKGRPQNETGIL